MIMPNHSHADVILTSSAVFTGLTDTPIATSIAVQGNTIVAIGTTEELEAWMSPQTRIYDYEDKLIMAGFHDFHLHILLGSVSLDSVNLKEARSEEDAVMRVKAYADERPHDPWILGTNWDAGHWDNKNLPGKKSLDDVLPDRPVLLLHNEGHFAWVNSKALEMVNISEGFDNLQFGGLAKDENGDYTGMIYEHAIGLFSKSAYHLTKEKKERVLRHFFRYAASLGITAMDDLYPTEAYEALEDFEVLKEFEDRGELSARIHLYPVLNSDLERAKRLKEHYQSSMLRVAGLKQFTDGVVTAFTAALVEPYTNKLNFSGDTAFPADTIKKWVVDADREGFAIRFHACGDRGVRIALDAYEEAQKVNGVRDSRHAIEHIEVIHPNDIPRFAELGVIASMQPEHMYLANRETYTAFIGEERAKYAWPLKSLQDTGAVLSVNSDFPVAGLNPMLEIYRAVTRVDSSNRDQWNPNEAISLASVLKAYTIAPAYGTFREYELGTLEPGKLADIIVLDRNLFAVPSEEILETKVELTMMDGKIMYTKEHREETV